MKSQPHQNPRMQRWLASLMAGAASLALAPAAMADDAAGEISGVTVVGEKDAGRTATATKTDTALADVPQAVTVITEQFIEDTAMQSMADVVRYVPGVTMGQGEGHFVGDAARHAHLDLLIGQHHILRDLIRAAREGQQDVDVFRSYIAPVESR